VQQSIRNLKMSGRLAVAIRHVEFEDCGTLSDVLQARGYEIRYVDAGRDDLSSVDAVAPELLIGLGGPASVYDTVGHRWITDELNLIERRLRANKPLLGICFGAQMLSRALGARVYAAPVKELGWQPLQLTREGERSLVRPLGPQHTSMLHWHGDIFDLPQGAVLLASTGEAPHQIYQHGNSVLAFQCHPEIRVSEMESWLVGYAEEVAAATGTSAEELRADTLRFGPTLARQAKIVFESWLDAVAMPQAQA
jgi:GMP synthase (glutamine-hydrolysing)